MIIMPAWHRDMLRTTIIRFWKKTANPSAKTKYMTKHLKELAI